MATVPSTAEADRVAEYDDYIDQQIEKTSFHVRTVDLVTGLILLGVVLLGSLLAIVIVDHWIVGLGFVARFTLLVILVAAALFVLMTRVLPPLFRSINPEYAAQTVERTFPSLKNGLVNFLFFRERPTEIRESVFDGMRHQTATELAGVPIDSAVDRSPIIRLGYGLVTITAIWVAYILFSPKNPLQTIQRIATPWRDIARPSQVDILEVMPGTVDVFRGQTVEVRAKVNGLKEEDLPVIEFSTLDGQLANQQLPMHEDGAAGHFAGTLTTSDSGIQQDLEYRVVAGDAISRTYEVHASEAPHIVVDRIEYDYPAYTNQTDETVQGEGDIRAIEGTRVTVYGKANQPIGRGHIEFLATPVETVDTPTESKQAAMTASGEESQLRFTLRLDSTRKRSIYRAYRLHFVNEHDLASVDPIEYSIEVIPDLRPIVQILTPSKRTIEVPENSWQEIEVRAVDPDYQLTRIQLAARTRARVLLKENLFVASRLGDAYSGQFVTTYNFVPSEHTLKEGDVVEYWAMAEDTRHSPLQNKLDPNHTDSSKQYIRIVAADPTATEPPPSQEPTPAPKDSPQPNDPQTGERQNNGGEQNKAGDEENQEENQNGPGDQQRQSGSDEPGEETSDQQEVGEEGESGLKQKGNNGGESKQQELDSGEMGDPQDGPSDSQPKPGGDQPSESGSSDAGDSDPTESNEPDSANSGDKNNGGSPGSDGGDSSDEIDRGARDDEPLPSTGERDGEVIERIKEHMEETGGVEEKSRDSQESGKPAGDEPADSQDSGEPSDDSSDSQDPDAGKPADSSRDPSATEPSESPQANEDDSRAPESQSQDDKQRDQQGNPSDDPSTNGGSESNRANDGVPSKDPAAPGDQGDRHTDAANTADEPGPSPPDGKQQADEPVDPSPRDGGEESDPSNETRQNGDPRNQQSGNESEAQDSGNQDTEGGQQDKTGSEDGQPSGSQAGDENADQSETKNGKDGQKGSETNEQPSAGTSKQGDQSDTDSSSRNKDNSKSNKNSESSSSDTSGSPSGSPSGQGNTSQNGEGDADGASTGDDANLEYTKQATDLVLEYLGNQENKPDQELLDKLGWKQEDVAKFLRRWNDMKKKAQGTGVQADDGKRKLDDVLRGMGLRAPDSQVRRSRDRDDTQRNNRNTGRRTKVPANLLDPFRAFQRGLQQKRSRVEQALPVEPAK